MKHLQTLLLLTLVSASHASFSYSDNLDALPTANSFTFLDNWVDNSTLPNWYRTLISDGTPGVENRFRVDDGSAESGSLWSLGAFGSTERALGFTPSSNLPTQHIGVRLVNTTGQVLTEASISYLGEQWRQGADGFDALRFSYQIGAPTLTGGTWNAVPSMDFAALHQTGSPTRRDGNLAENRAQVSGVLSGLDWQPGESLWLRWTGLDRARANHTLAVDDLRVEAVPEPATALVVLVGLAGLRARRSAKVKE